MDRLSPRPRRAHALAIAAAVVAGLAAALAPMGTARAAAGPPPEAACRTSGPDSGAYTVTVCIERPGDLETLSGEAAIAATATVSPAGAPGVQRMVFGLDGEYLLTDYAPDAAGRYAFTLRTTRFADGVHTLTAHTLMRDGFTSEASSVRAHLENGVETPPVNTRTFTPRVGTEPAPGEPFVLAAAGDGASGVPGEARVVGVIESWKPNLFLYLGDVYEKGTPAEFDNWYGAPGAEGGYGRFHDITNPAIGNHEYEGNAAPGYVDYWDNVADHYAVDTHGWRLISLNSNGQFGQTGPGSPQYQWLERQLTENPRPCTLVFFHHPRFNIGEEGASTRMNAIWQLMAQRGVDVVLTGHDHTYQRWLPLDGAGAPDPAGPTQFVVGTGGHGLQVFVQSDDRVAAALGVFGALRMELNPEGAAYRFVSGDGLSLDSGSIACSGAPGAAPDAGAPSAPSALEAAAESRTRVTLSWTPAADNVGVTGHDVYRDGELLAHAGPEAAFTDATAIPGATHVYAVVARDAAGNASPQSAEAQVTTDALATLFADDFEGGSMSRWDEASGISVEDEAAFSGRRGARARSAGEPALAARSVPDHEALHYRVRFKVLSRGEGGPLNLLSFSTASGSRLLSLSLSAGGRLAVTGIPTTNASPVVTEGEWHTAQVRLTAGGEASEVAVWLDGVQAWPLTGTVALAAGRIGRIELGDGAAGRAFDVAFDEVAVDPQPIADTSPPTPPEGLTATAASGVQIDLSWQPSNDDTRLAGYDVYRDCSPGTGTACEPIASVGGTSYSDTAVSPLASYFYVVAARDAEGNRSLPSAPANADTPELFEDGFEGGDLSRWTDASGLEVVTSPVAAGSRAARAASAGERPSHAYKTLGAGLPDMHARVRFRIERQGANQVALLRLATAAGAPVVTAAVSPTGKLMLINGPAGTSATSQVSPAPGVWHELQVHARAGELDGRHDVWLDGAPVAALSGPANLGEAPIARLSIGDPAPSGHTYDVVFDDVLAGEAFLADVTPPTPPAALAAVAASASDVDLAWEPGADNLAVAGYEIVRDGTRIATAGAVGGYRDRTAVPGGTHTYAVFAVDAAGNVSATGATAEVTMPQPVTEQTLSPVADAYVSEGAPATRYGGGATLRVDAAPLTRSYLRFQVSGLAGPPARATLRVFAASAQKDGYTAHAAGSGWDEATITHATAPALGEAVEASGAVAAGSWTSVDVTPLVTGNGPLTIGLSTPSGTALSLASRESGATAPQLVIEGAPAAPSSDTRPPTAPAGLTATAAGPTRVDLAWQASADDAGVTGYTVYRDGVRVAALDGDARSWTDTSAAPAMTYTYSLDAVDAAGNRSPRTAQVPATTPAPDTQAPSAPSGLTATATAAGVELSWSASADDVAVTGYTVYRDGAELATVGAVTSSTDAAVAPGTAYRYEVEALDAAGNRSPRSEAATVTTPGETGAASVTVEPEADAYVNADAASANHGAATTLRADAAPLIRSYLRFTVRGLAGPATRAILRVRATTSHKGGYDVMGVADTGWSEAAITHATAPATGARIGGSGAFAAGEWTTVDVTPHVTGNGAYSLALVTTSGTAMSLSSRESASPPQLVVESNGGAGDARAPAAPSGLAATAGADGVALSWTAAEDEVGVSAYTVYRDGQELATVAGTAYADAAVAPGTTYRYEVDAVDAAGNRSARSQAVSATTPGDAAPVALTAVAAADGYTSSDQPATAFGTAATLRADASPLIRGFLRFTVAGLGGPATRATLRLYATGAHSTGYEVWAVEGDDWTESVTHAGAPAVGARLGASGPIAGAGWTSVDITPYVTGDGAVSVAVTTPSNTALALSSREGANPPQLVVERSGAAPAPGTRAPSAPAGLTATATGAGVELSWEASGDDAGVAGHVIHRDGAELATVGAVTSYTDAAVAPGTAYTYQVEALDAAGNRSPRSEAATVTTPAEPAAGGPAALSPVADAYVSEGAPTTRYGGGATLRVDAAPLTRSYLRFQVSGLAGPPARATLRVFALSSQSAGYTAHAVAGPEWEEAAITHATAPALGEAAGASGAVAAGSWTSVDVTPLVAGDGPLTIGLSTPSGTALSLASRESGATAPQLVIEP